MMCGPDCLAYLFPPSTAAEIARACGTDESGTRLGAMAQWVETQGRVAGVKLRHARVKLPKGGYTIMYWVE